MSPHSDTAILRFAWAESGDAANTIASISLNISDFVSLPMKTDSSGTSQHSATPLPLSPSMAQHAAATVAALNAPRLVASPEKSVLPLQRRLYVVFATDDYWLKYAASAPTASYVWSSYFSVTPLVYLYSENHSAPRPTVIRHLIEVCGGSVTPLVPRPFQRGDVRATATQVVRLAAILRDDLHPDDILVTADSDVWPLSREFWTSVLTRGNSSRMWIYHGVFWANKLKENDSNFAQMSYAVGTVGRWRELYATWCVRHGLPQLPVGVVMPLLRQLLDAGAAHIGPAWFEHREFHDAQWTWDQILLGQWLSDSGLHNVDVNTNVHRLDRGERWNVDGATSDEVAIQQFTDTHLTNGFFADEVFLAQRRIWLALGLNVSYMDVIRSALSEVSASPVPMPR